MMAKMKSLWASESQAHFSLEAPSPTPHQPPSARAYMPWTDWPHMPLGSDWQAGSKKSAMRPIRLLLV